MHSHNGILVEKQHVDIEPHTSRHEGRSSKRGYAYITYKESELKDNGRKRLSIINSSDHLGAGFNIASQDLDIRGGGSIIGEEQSGFIKEIGTELYHQMLEEEINLQKSKINSDFAKKVSFQPIIKIPVEIYIPEVFINDVDLRLSIYKRISNINNKFIFASPKLGDIVIFEYPEDRNRNFVKRIVAQPGDTISMENGNVYINGNKLIESYVVNTGSTDYLPYLIKENEYFVLGDNRSASNDSRSWGTIKTEHLIGKYMFQYNSPMCSVIKYKSNEIQ